MEITPGLIMEEGGNRVPSLRLSLYQIAGIRDYEPDETLRTVLTREKIVTDNEQQMIVQQIAGRHGMLVDEFNRGKLDPWRGPLSAFLESRRPNILELASTLKTSSSWADPLATAAQKAVLNLAVTGYICSRIASLATVHGLLARLEYEAYAGIREANCAHKYWIDLGCFHLLVSEKLWTPLIR